MQRALRQAVRLPLRQILSQNTFSEPTELHRCLVTAIPASATSTSGRPATPPQASAWRSLALPQAPGWPADQRRGLFIRTQATPNPSSLMFQPGSAVMEAGSANFASAREAMASPLARKLFGIDGVTLVFFGADFVTVTKSDDYEWQVLKPDIFAAIMDHFTSGEPLFLDAEAANASDTAIHDDDSEVVAMIKELLETRIRPSVQEDGGDIQFRGFEEDSGVVVLKMQGACSGCPSSSITLKSGIENMLMHYVPEVKSVVEAEPDEYENVGLKEFSKLERQLSA